MLSIIRRTLLYLLLVYIRETISLSHESTDGLKSSTAFNYTEGPLIYPFPVQLAKEKLLYYSNDTGITLHCPLQGTYNEINWIIVEPSSALNTNILSGRRVTRIPQLIEPLSNGSIYILPFSPSAYRQDVHSITIYCMARNNIGTTISSPQRVRAVISQYYEVSVFDEYVIRGCTAVLKCHIPSFMRPFVAVISWIKNSAYEIVGHGEKYSVFPSGELHIRDAMDDHSFTGYRCKIRNLVNNETKLSSQGSVIVSDPSNSITPRIIDCRSIIVVEEFTDLLELPCAAQAKPIPTYSWYKVSKLDGLPHALNNHQRYEYRKGSLIMRNVRAIDANKYICIAANNIGEAKCETEVITFAPLRASVGPKKLVVEVNQRAIINCSVHGYPFNKMIWLHNGHTLDPNDESRHIQYFSDQSILVINAVANSDQGIWQCFVSNSGGDSALDTTQLILDGLPPYFIELFDDQNVSIEDKISLKCVGTGHPIPMITWSLDGSSVESRKQEPNTLQNALWGDYVSDRNRIVSYLNLTINSVFDGGLYECIVKNKAGINRHSAHIKVNGPTKIRQMHNINVTAMQSIILHCPVVGNEPNIIEWHKDNKKLPLNHRHRVHANGTFEMMHLDKNSDSGIYTCIAFGNENSEVAKQSFLMQVKVPPVIEHFSFDAKLEAGMRTRIYCNVAQGDQPVTIMFLKDNKPIKGNHDDGSHGMDGISVQEVDRFSLSLAIENLSSIHNGNYSCIASNEAATVSYSSILLVNVPPKWIIEPKNAQAVEGNSVTIDCAADGFPIVQITWKRLVNSYGKESVTKGVHQQYLLIRSGPKYQVYENGTLRITKTDINDLGEYLCQASNGIGGGLSKLVNLNINFPAHFKDRQNVVNLSVHINHSIELIAEAIGDRPIEFQWKFSPRNRNDEVFEIKSDSNYIIDSKETENGIISKLKIGMSSRNDSGLFKCNVVNVFGSDVKTFNLIVQEPPEAPEELSVISKSSRTIALSWKRPYTGNDQIKEYVIQYMNEESTSPLKNVSLYGNMTTTVLRGLHPSKEYKIALYAINSVGKSKPSEAIKFITEEESPAGPPTQVQLTSIDSTSIKVDWQSPPSDQTNGELKGFYIGYKALNTKDPFMYKTVQTKFSMTSDSAFSMILQGLRPYTHYSVIVQAYNGVGAGPRSDEMTVTTGESIPSTAPYSVSCVSFSSESITVSWNGLPQENINGVLKGYRVHYRPTNNKDVIKNEVTASQNKLTLYGLQKNTNYSIAVNAFTKVGEGSASDSIYCKTQEDLPSQPNAIKALLSSPDSVIVSWKLPKEPNGLLRKYTVYRKTSNDNEVISFTVPSHLTYHKTNNLIRNKKYSFWVTASTSVGEGPSSSIVSVIINSKIPSRIVSFGDQMEGNVGEHIELLCRSVGIPSSNTEWRVNGKIINLENVDKNERIYVLLNGSLRISNTTINDSGNYSCQTSNIHGSDSITYGLKIRRDSQSSWLPLSPIIKVLSVTSSSITISWQLRGEENSPIKAHEVYFRSSQNKEWKYYIITEEGVNRNRSFVIEHLQCGTHYQIYMINVNNYGKSSPSDVINVRTSGREPISPTLKTFITRINETSIKLHLNSWKDGGCPFVSHPIIHWKAIDSTQWNLLFVNSLLESTVITELIANKNYTIKVMMKNTAGSTVTEYEVQSFNIANNIYHISGHSPVHITVDHFDKSETEDNELIPLLFTIVISLILLLAGLLSIFVLYKAMQKRLNPNHSGEQTINSSILRKVAFVHNKNSRIAEPIDGASAELTSLTCTQDHSQSKSFNESRDSITTTSFHSKDDISYKYVSIPKQEISSDYYSIVQKKRKCNTNAKQALMVDVSPNSANRYAIPGRKFDTEKELQSLENCDHNCCNYLSENQKGVDCPCCAIFDPECCGGMSWQPMCEFDSTNSQHLPTAFNNRKYVN